MTPRPARIAAAALLPPLGVYLEEGAVRPFQLACGLTLLGFLPGAGYALWRLFQRRKLMSA
ncbi:YqaE/Pmp3 family membrane protein [uncultured Sphingomonas sp.]|uniref:YqaE/Pmp3 family membrane protein n=1 Tax=uncultured Sphingomonas sp. TaxID=158754 RepID=UPI0025ECDEC0|nr:YqaE/Pmp3 family membrane protein [uncultured Sphingomonas sp.]